MAALVGGFLLATTVAFATLYWQLLVRPEVLLSFWRDGSMVQEDWFDHHPAGLRALRWATGATLFLLGFLTGLAWSFLVTTA